MFLPSRSSAVGSFTPPALPGFFAIPYPIPSEWPFAGLRSSLCRHTQPASVFRPRTLLACLVNPLAQCVVRCCLRPRGGAGSRLWRATSVACGHWNGISLSLLLDFGANYQIQRLTLHLPTFLCLCRLLHLRRRVSAVTLSVVTRVPSYSLVLPPASSLIQDG